MDHTATDGTQCRDGGIPLHGRAGHGVLGCRHVVQPKRRILARVPAGADVFADRIDGTSGMSVRKARMEDGGSRIAKAVRPLSSILYSQSSILNPLFSI